MDFDRIARKTTWVLFLTQSLGSAGVIAVATVSTIAGAELSGAVALAGVPSAVNQLGAAFSALLWGYLMERWGRRNGLTAGLLVGVLAAIVASFGLNQRSFGLFLLGMALMGSSIAAVQLARFAAAEVHPPEQRGRAISNVVVGGTVGAILGPLMVGPAGNWAQQAGLNELSGPFLVMLVFMALCVALVFALLRPDPREVGQALSALYPPPALNSAASNDHRLTLFSAMRRPAVFTAVMAMVFGQMVMVMVMAVTSLHMKNHQHGLGAISLVLSAHTLGMFGFSVISGRLSDRWGRAPVIVAGAGTLALSCLMAPLSPQVFPLALALLLLGLGWNFCYVGGSSLLSDALTQAERARIQGANDLLIGLASALGGLLSGFALAGLGYTALSLLGAALALIPLGLAVRWQAQHKRLAPAGD
jgi:MFS family permease